MIEVAQQVDRSGLGRLLERANRLHDRAGKGFGAPLCEDDLCVRVGDVLLPGAWAEIAEDLNVALPWRQTFGE